MASSRTKDGEVVGKDAVSRAQDIHPQALECKDLFTNYLNMTSPYAPQVSACQHRFLNWASFLGVFASESASLDRRLEFNPEIKELVMSMLRVLKRNLERILVRHAPGHLASTNIGAVEDDGAMYGIIGAVDRLHRLAVAIRQSPRTDEVERVRNFASKQKPDDFPGIQSAIMKFLFPNAEGNLQVQLVESIVYRRHRMLWSRRHSKKLGTQRKKEEDSKPAGAETTPRVEQCSHQNVTAHATHRKLPPKIESESALSSTQPSRRLFDKTNNKLVLVKQEGQNEDVHSVSSANFSPRAQYPEMPSVPMGETKVSCPYCLSDIEVPLDKDKARKEWIGHLNTDLRPYVCVSEECRNFPTSFSSEKKWKAHMDNNHGVEWARYIHRVKWSCPFCGDNAGSFSSEDLLIRHLANHQVEKPPLTLDGFELAKIKSKGKVVNPRQANQCPLCGPPPWNTPKMSKKTRALSGKPDTLYGHFVDHLQHLALLSISWWDWDVGITVDTPDSGYGSADAIRLNSEIGGNQNNETDAPIHLDDGTIEKLKVSLIELELHGQMSHDTLVEQQRRLWEKLQPSLDNASQTEYQELRDRLEWSDQVPEDDLLMQLDELHERLRLEAEAVMPQKKRLEQISGEHVEPRDSDSAAISRLEIGLDHRVDIVDNTVIDHMMKIHGFLQEMNLPPDTIAPGYDHTILGNELRSSEVKFGRGDDEFIVPLHKQNTILNRKAIKPFFDHLIGSVSSALGSDKDSVVKYCTDEVCNALVYYFPGSNEEKIASRKKIFAVLLLVQRPAAIISFIKEKVSDLDLPIRLADRRLARDGVNANSVECQTGRRISCFSNWKDSEIDSFLRYQWRIYERPEGIGSAAMSDSSHSSKPKRHAILIGIDSYEDKPLFGAVRDVKRLASYLGKADSDIALHTLTASAPSDTRPFGNNGNKNDWPSNKNFSQTLHRVTKLAKAGDSIYIHYSGQGTTLPEGFALVLLKEDNTAQYFHSQTLAFMINVMAEKDVAVTLVLDCCFSGTVQRGESHRFLRYDPSRSFNAPLDGEDLLEHEAPQLYYRDSDMMSHFNVISARKYAIIVACGPDQEASEARLGASRELHGKLSYFLLEAFRDAEALERSVREIFDHVSLDFLRGWQKQHLMLYGYENLPFFGTGTRTRAERERYDPSYWQVQFESGDQLQISAGRAHGITDGDKFKLTSKSSLATLTTPIVVVVSHAKEFTSEINTIAGGIDNSLDWRAIIQVQNAVRKFPIKLSSRIRDMLEVVGELQCRSLEIASDQDDSPCFFRVEHEEDKYHILNSDRQGLVNVPAMKVSEVSIYRLGEVLEHLAKFQVVKELQNPEVPESFNTSFDASVTVCEQKFNHSQTIPINEADRAKLTIINKGSRDLFISIYVLGSQWDVVNLSREAFAISRGQKSNLEFGMFIPKSMKKQGHETCEDILKLFITSHPVCMYNLQLPKLDASPILVPAPKRVLYDDDIPKNWVVRDFKFHVTHEL